MGPISSRQSPFVAGPSPNVKKPVKMVMCVNYNNSGHCDRGETCTYAHGLEELHEYRMKQVSDRPSRILDFWLRQELKESQSSSVRTVQVCLEFSIFINLAEVSFWSYLGLS